jgi:hypothetical protein
LIYDAINSTEKTTKPSSKLFPEIIFKRERHTEVSQTSIKISVSGEKKSFREVFSRSQKLNNITSNNFGVKTLCVGFVKYL